MLSVKFDNSEKLTTMNDSIMHLEVIYMDKVFTLEEIINISLKIVKNGGDALTNTLDFFETLFDEYCHQYCALNNFDNKLKINEQRANVKAFHAKLLKFVRFINSKFDEYGKPLKNESLTTTTANNNNSLVENSRFEDGPQSPPKEYADDYEMEDLSLNLQNDSNLLLINLVDGKLPLITEKLTHILINETKEEDLGEFYEDENEINEENLYITDSNHEYTINEWAIQTITILSAKNHHSILDSNGNVDPNSNLIFVKTLSFWKQCPIMQLLIDLISKCMETITPNELVDPILRHSSCADWILATLLANMPKGEHLDKYIKLLIQQTSTSTINMLAYVAEHNAHAIESFSKSNIPFLLKLCTNSKKLCNLLAQECVKKVDVKTMNKLNETLTGEEMDSCLFQCILNASNCFELLNSSFDLMTNPESSKSLIERIWKILSMIVEWMHKIVYESSREPSNDDDLALFIVLRNNVEQLIAHSLNTKHIILKRIQLRLLKLTCIHHGPDFVAEVFHHLMNEPNQNINVDSYPNLRINNFITILLKSLRLHLGFDVFDCIKATLELHHHKTLSYWANLMILNESNSIDLDVAKLTSFLMQKSFETEENVFQIYFILKTLIKIFEDHPQLYTFPHYRLCFNLVSIYFDLMSTLNDQNESFIVAIMDCLVQSQKLLKNLAENLPLNEYVVGRTLLDFIDDRKNLFQKQYFIIEQQSIMNGHVSLLNRNIYSNSKLKKNPLRQRFHLSTKRKCLENPNAVLNRQLLIDLLQTCIQNQARFALEFVNSLSNELLCKNQPLLEDDPKDGGQQVQQFRTLQTTIETDLQIYRSFDENPILWNILQLLSKHKCLKHCLVIIKSILNVLRTNLFSSTPANKNTLITQKFISLLANDEILPNIPFLYITEIVQQIQQHIQPLEMAYILYDIAKYIRDKNEMNQTTTMMPIKSYLKRFRLILAHKKPDKVYLKLFKNLTYSQ